MSECQKMHFFINKVPDFKFGVVFVKYILENSIWWSSENLYLGVFEIANYEIKNNF